MTDPLDDLIANRMGGTPQQPIVREINGVMYQWNPQTEQWELPPGVVFGPQMGGQDDSRSTSWRTLPNGNLALLDDQTGEVIREIPAETAQREQYVEHGGSLYVQDPSAPNGLRLILPKPPPAAPQRAPRFPEEIELQQLQIEQARRSMEDPYTQAMRQNEAVINSIQQQLASGQITMEEADRMMALSRANLSAALKGTTPFQLDQARQQTKRQQETLAQSHLQSQLGSSSSMATGLLSGLGGIYGNILGGQGPPLDFNPLAMAQGFTHQMGGGPELAERARAVLMGAFGQEGM